MILKELYKVGAKLNLRDTAGTCVDIDKLDC